MIHAQRIVDSPIICPGLDLRSDSESIGNNINGPCLIRVPKWVTNPLGKYYLYFAHHMGRSIRLAYSDTLTGPWHLHLPGALTLDQSHFCNNDLEPETIDPNRSIEEQVDELFLYAHIASPDVHIDPEFERIYMYYHGLAPDREQYSRLAISQDGLEFQCQEPLLGPSYFRVFEYRGYFYAIAVGGELLRARHWNGPFEPGPTLFSIAPLIAPETKMRHAAVKREGEYLHLFYSRIGDEPERILYSLIKLDPDWNAWKADPPETLLHPKHTWEGAHLPVIKSKAGIAREPQHALRDPDIFEEDGRRYLLYATAAESGIAIAELSNL